MDLAEISDIPTLNQWLLDHGFTAYWIRAGGPRSEFKPFIWRWADLQRALDSAGQVALPQGDGQQTGARRIRLKNPHLGSAGTRTLDVSLQILMPGEHERMRRHGEAGLRFIVQGAPGATMVIDGETMALWTRDLITLPAGCWYGAANEGSEPVSWLEVLDGPIAGLGAVLREFGAPARAEAGTELRQAAIPLRHIMPLGFEVAPPSLPVRHSWEDTDATLSAVRKSERQADPCDGYVLSYTNPLTGGPALPTLSAEVQLLTAGLKTGGHRQNCTTIYYVAEGHGVSSVGDEQLEWGEGDVFVVPPWELHDHQNRSEGDAILFSVSDRAAMDALQLYRERVEA